jgi:3-methyladenine DNA glycosylase AlkD
MARFGIVSDTALGIPIPHIRNLAKELKKEKKCHELALELWKQDIHEAKILATMIDDPKLVTEQQMNDWANGFYSWDVCDQCCSNLFDRTPFCDKKIREWTKSEKEFVRRAGFVLMATSAVHDKKANDERFLSYLSIIEKYSTDDRNFVRKAVNWALRQIGKRNSRLHKAALILATKLKTMRPKKTGASSPVPSELKTQDNKTARWIGSDAVRELEKRK